MTTNTCGTRLTCSWADAQRVVCAYLLLGTLMSPTAPLWGGADGTCEIVSLDGVSDADLQTAIDAHVPGPEDSRTVEERLAQSGLTLAELSTALGL